MSKVAGYLLFFDTSDQHSFWDVLTWISYIIKEKRATYEHPRHYVIIGFVFPDKTRVVEQFQAEVQYLINDTCHQSNSSQYFVRLMGMTYIEVNAEVSGDLNKVWPQMINLFTVSFNLKTHQVLSLTPSHRNH